MSLTLVVDQFSSHSSPNWMKRCTASLGLRPNHPPLSSNLVSQYSSVISSKSSPLSPVEDVMMILTVFVDCDTAPTFTSQQNTIDDILVLHLEGGKDFFISVTGNYLPSCFGSSLETLVHLHTYIREVPTADLLDLSLSSSCSLPRPSPASSPSPAHSPSLTRRTVPPHDIPKELYQMVSFLDNCGLTTVSLSVLVSHCLIPPFPMSGEPVPGIWPRGRGEGNHRRSGCGRSQGVARLRPLSCGVYPPLPLGSE